MNKRERIEETLRRSEEQYHRLTANFSNGAVMQFDQDLRYVLAEGAGLELVGRSKEVPEGKTVWEALPPETAAVVLVGGVGVEEGESPPRLIITAEQGRGRGLPACGGHGELAHGRGLRALGARDDFKLDPVAFIQGTKAHALNRRVVDEDIRTTVLRNKPIALLLVKPLHSTLCQRMILLRWRERMLQRMSRRTIKKPQAASASPLRSLDVSRRSCTASRRKTLSIS